jgi:hypothetical protein
MGAMKRSLCEICGELDGGKHGICEQCDELAEQDHYGRSEDERLDDPRHGQADAINRERYIPSRGD